MKNKRHILGRFTNDKKGSSHLSPLHGSRHRRAQMSFFTKRSHRSQTKGIL